MILNELIKGIVLEWAQAGNSVDLYHDHAPQGTAYPFMTFNIVSSPRTFAMAATAGGTPHSYSLNTRVQFSVFGNEDQLAEVMAAMAEIEDTFAFQELSLSNGVTSICAHVVDQRVAYFDRDNKVWTATTDMIFRAGE